VRIILEKTMRLIMIERRVDAHLDEMTVAARDRWMIEGSNQNRQATQSD